MRLRFFCFLTLFFAVLSHAQMPATNHQEVIFFGSGCFWGAEKLYQHTQGVTATEVGYGDGKSVHPDYQTISSWQNKHNPNNYAETVKVTFNDNIISPEKLIKIYFEHHDPTQLNRQGNDVGTQYRSIIMTTTPEQLTLAKTLRDAYQARLTAAGYGKIVTVIKPFTNFVHAEAYHQDYLVKHPNGYCPDDSTGVTFTDATNAQEKIDNAPLLHGKQIVVLLGKGYCPYCEKFKRDVLNAYHGSIPLHFRYADQLQSLTLKTPTWATPTTFFLKDGKEVLGKQGYVDKADFYKLLGAFQLGKGSDAYDVAFDQGTDPRYCRQFAIFKNTPSGIFVDKLSGAPLFDTKDRYDSNTGWLSFTRPIKGAVVTREDNSYGMRRTEVISASTGIHLGHVFNDGPNGAKHYCLDATVLTFIPRDKMASAK